MPENNLSRSKAGALLALLAMADIPQDGDIVTPQQEGMGAFLVTADRVVAGKPCSIPCRDGQVAKTFFTAKYDGACWNCKQEEIEQEKTLITRWGGGWVSFECFCKEASEHDAVVMLDRANVTRAFWELFDAAGWGDNIQRVRGAVRHPEYPGLPVPVYSLVSAPRARSIVGASLLTIGAVARFVELANSISETRLAF